MFSVGQRNIELMRNKAESLGLKMNAAKCEVIRFEREHM